MAVDAWDVLQERLRHLNIFEKDLSEHFIRSSGHGGQNVNKVSTCVILTHHPSGLVIRCEEERSQARNRFLARKRLADRWEFLESARKNKERTEMEKRRRQKRKRNKISKERMLKNKHHRSDIKKNRQHPRHEDQ